MSGENLRFEWDENKNAINIRKHGITFEEAVSVFFDADAVEFDDYKHSDFEERFLIIGFTEIGRLCIVCHCYRDDGGTVRIISARKATKHEAEIYERERF